MCDKTVIQVGKKSTNNSVNACLVAYDKLKRKNSVYKAIRMNEPAVSSLDISDTGCGDGGGGGGGSSSSDSGLAACTSKEFTSKKSI